MTMKTPEPAEVPASAYANRRSHERISAKFEVRFEGSEDAARALHAYSLNMSAGGLCLRTRHSYDVGSRVRLELSVDNKKFNLEGIISWVRDESEAIGVRFVDVSEEDQQRLQQVVKNFKR